MESADPPVLPHKKKPFVKIHGIPRIALKYRFFRTLKSSKKSILYPSNYEPGGNPRTPPSYPIKKQPFVKIHWIPRIALKYRFFRTLKIIKKKHFISLELWAGWESADPPFLPHEKTTLCQNTRNTANRVKVQFFSDIKNHQKITFYIPRIMSRVGIRGRTLPTP